MTECFSCHKELGSFSKRGNKKDIVRAGYQPNEEMSDTDVLCQNCLEQFGKTQERGKRRGERSGMAGQIVVGFIFPLIAFWRIGRAGDFILRWLAFSGVFLGVGITLMFLGEDNESLMTVGVSMFLFWYIGG